MHINKKIKAIIWKKCFIINEIQFFAYAPVVKWHNKSLVMTSSLVSTGWEHHNQSLKYSLMYPINIKYINYYLFIIFIFSVFYLFEKHTVGNDSTISEWIINYEGGFTKRGIIGQISIILSNFFEIKLRESILILQIILVGIYYLLLRKLLINLKINKIFYFAIFSPIFII